MENRDSGARNLFVAPQAPKHLGVAKIFGASMSAAPFIRPLFEVLIMAINLYWWVIIIMAIMSWLLAFDVINMRNEFVRSIWNGVNALTEPALRPIRRFIPPLGGMDISPIILLLLLSFITRELEILVYQLPVMG
jgi:YggT family protein